MGASATGRTMTASGCSVKVVLPSLSVVVPRTVSVKSSSRLAGGVMVSALKSQAVISIALSVAVAVKLLVPSLSVAPAGIANTSIVSASLPSASTSATSSVRSMAVSSSPLAG